MGLVLSKFLKEVHLWLNPPELVILGLFVQGSIEQAKLPACSCCQALVERLRVHGQVECKQVAEHAGHGLGVGCLQLVMEGNPQIKGKGNQ
eukprot:3114345-Lingulodinium_polyedra.AAC.1